MRENGFDGVDADAAAPLLRLIAYLAAARPTCSDRAAEDEAIDAYAAIVSPHEKFAVTAAIDTLLRRQHDDAQLRAAVQAFGLTFAPNETDGSVRGWLRDVRHRIAQ